MSLSPPPRNPALFRAAASRRDATQAATLREMRLDVDQIESLMGDAIVRLMDGFDSLHAAAGAQHRMLVSVASGADTAQRQDITALDAAADGAIDRLVTALQFHDIASQLLAQLGTRIDTLYRLTPHAAEGRGDPVVTDMHNGAVRRTTPVTQSNMTAGAVQLF